MLTRLILLLFCLTLAQTSAAWGRQGHLVSCDIAWRLVQENTRNAIRQLLRNSHYRTFAQSCLWADEIRKLRQYRYAAPHHFSNLPRGADTGDALTCPPEGCVTGAILAYQKGLTDWRLGSEQAAVAPPYSNRPVEMLMYLGHFVSDLHQPLHVSPEGTRGGTRDSLRLSEALMSWRKSTLSERRDFRLPWRPQDQDLSQVNLHVFWDHDVVSYPERRSWKKQGQHLYEGISDKQRINWQRDTLATWAMESYRKTATIFHRHNQNQPFQPEELQAETQWTQRRLQQAGVRLAHLLDQTLMADPSP